MQDAIAVLNAGSSSLKFAVYRLARGSAPERVLHGQVEGVSGADGHARALAEFELRLAREAPALRLLAAGHRLVHGGARFSAPALVTDAVLAELRALVPLAPRHQPHAIAAIEALRAARPELAQVACFDTAFHRTLPELAQRFAIPRELHDAGIRRYGFHGLSLESIAEQLPAQLGAAAERVRQHGGVGRDDAFHVALAEPLGRLRGLHGLGIGSDAADAGPEALGAVLEQLEPVFLAKGRDARQMADFGAARCNTLTAARSHSTNDTSRSWDSPPCRGRAPGRCRSADSRAPVHRWSRVRSGSRSHAIT